MSWTVTLVLSAVTLAIVVFCAWRGSRVPDLSRPRLIPYRMIMVLGSAFLLMLIVHMINLGGVATGPVGY